jgi:multidrug efflux system outer membrane protein
MMARISPLAAALTALTLAGCAIGPDYQRPSAALPASFDASPTRAASAAVQADWWVPE